MGKTVEDICNVLIKNQVSNINTDIISSQKKCRTLSSIVCCSYPENSNPYKALFNDDNLYNELERAIIKELAVAIDKNSVSRIKHLKSKYGHLNEFKNAKNYLDKKCKEVWNVYEDNKNVPKDAMKSLGITNQPELDFLLGNSLKYYEKDNSDTTSYIISSILKNQNLSYTMDEIHKYLKDMNCKLKCQYNFKTVRYLITKQNYSKSKLDELGINKENLEQALKELSLKEKLKFYLSK